MDTSDIVDCFVVVSGGVGLEHEVALTALECAETSLPCWRC